MTNDSIKRFTLRLPYKLYSKLVKEANIKGVSLNSLILQILWDWENKTAPQ